MSALSKVKIYQIKDIQNTPYVFMSWNYAKDKFNMDDYNLVAEFETGATLDTIFEWGNNDRLQQHFKMRSLSVSDIIEVDGVKYYIDNFGFVEIEE